jgi:hypothetical protein
MKAQRPDLVAEALLRFLSLLSYARVRDEQGRLRMRTLLLAREGEPDVRHLDPATLELTADPDRRVRRPWATPESLGLLV